jgi:hypothetical protein
MIDFWIDSFCAARSQCSKRGSIDMGPLHISRANHTLHTSSCSNGACTFSSIDVPQRVAWHSEQASDDDLHLGWQSSSECLDAWCLQTLTPAGLLARLHKHASSPLACHAMMCATVCCAAAADMLWAPWLHAGTVPLTSKPPSAHWPGMWIAAMQSAVGGSPDAYHTARSPAMHASM